MPTRALLATCCIAAGFAVSLAGTHPTPAHADALDGYCINETWDEATGALTETYTADAPEPVMDIGTDSGEFTGGRRCPFHDRPSSVTVTTAKKLDLSMKWGLGHFVDSENEVNVTIDTRPADYAPTIKLYFYNWSPDDFQPTKPRTIRLTRDGIDLTGDGDTDLKILAPYVRSLEIRTWSGADTFVLRKSDSDVVYRDINLETFGGNDVVIADLPMAEFSVGLGAGNDRVWVRSRTAHIGGDGGNDVIDAARVTHGCTCAGGYGNDRIITGPGNDYASFDKISATRMILNCGPGRDITSNPFPHRTSCERVYSLHKFWL